MQGVIADYGIFLGSAIHPCSAGAILGYDARQTEFYKIRGGGSPFSSLDPSGTAHWGPRPFPNGRVFFRGAAPLLSISSAKAVEADVDKESKEALQVTKELVAKFIETRNISPGNFSEIFPAIYQVVLSTISPAHEAQDKKD